MLLGGGWLWWMPVLCPFWLKTGTPQKFDIHPPTTWSNFRVTEPNCWHPGLFKPGGKPLVIALESSSYCCISPISAASLQKLMLVVGGWWHTAWVFLSITMHKATRLDGVKVIEDTCMPNYVQFDYLSVRFTSAARKTDIILQGDSTNLSWKISMANGLYIRWQAELKLWTWSALATLSSILIHLNIKI